MRKKGYILAPIVLLLIGGEIALMSQSGNLQIAGGIVGLTIGASAILFLTRWSNHRGEPPDDR
jgi:hypothetical protein